MKELTEYQARQYADMISGHTKPEQIKQLNELRYFYTSGIHIGYDDGYAAHDAKVSGLVEALKWYAQKGWDETVTIAGIRIAPFYSDKGMKAKQALKNYEGES